MKNWFAAMLPLLLIVVMPPFNTAMPGSAGTETNAAVAAIQGPYTVTVYLDQVHIGSDGATLTGDPIEWYQGEAAAVAFAEHEPDAGIDGPLDDYYIVNHDEEKVSFPVAKDAEVRVQIYDHTGQMEDIVTNWNESVSLQKFGERFKDTDLVDLSQFPYHLTIAGGQVVKIVQQYIP